MLDPRFVKDNLELVNKSLKDRGMEQDLADFEKSFDQRRKILKELEDLGWKKGFLQVSTRSRIGVMELVDTLLNILSKNNSQIQKTRNLNEKKKDVKWHP